MIDVHAAFRSLLRSEPIIAGLTDRIYVGEIPREEVEKLPDKVILLVPAGGLIHNRLLPLLDPRIDVWSLGKTYHEASTLDRAVCEVLRHLIRRVVDSVLIHSIGWSGGPFMVRDDLTGWPALWRSVVIYADARPTNGG